MAIKRAARELINISFAETQEKTGLLRFVARISDAADSISREFDSNSTHSYKHKMPKCQL